MADADLLAHAVATNWRAASLSPADFALCEFAAKLTQEQHKMTPADLDTLRGHGFSDRAIHDAVQIIGFFNYITRIADALGVELEDFIQPSGND
ncbi:MAG: peroxidase [Caldilineaceae bacterium]|nr:peroxidase [Caldilineaceae bacterium]